MCQKLIYDLKNMIFDFNNFHFLNNICHLSYGGGTGIWIKTQNKNNVRFYFNYENVKLYMKYVKNFVQNSIELKKKCNLKKTDFSSLSFVIYPKFRLNGSIDDCFVFQDMDFYSKELLYFFVSKTVNFYVFHFNNKRFIFTFSIHCPQIWWISL